MIIVVLSGVVGIVIGQIIIVTFFLVKDRDLNRAWKQRQRDTERRAQ